MGEFKVRAGCNRLTVCLRDRRGLGAGQPIRLVPTGGRVGRAVEVRSTGEGLWPNLNCCSLFRRGRADVRSRAKDLPIARALFCADGGTVGCGPMLDDACAGAHAEMAGGELWPRGEVVYGRMPALSP